MRTIIAAIILFLFPFGLTIPQENLNSDKNSLEKPISDYYNDDSDNGSALTEFLSSEPDTFSRKHYQKVLKPLSDKDKIKWSFKMADSDIFL